MTLVELVAEVQLWTKRPDLEPAARSALRRNLLKYHRRHYFFKDLIDGGTIVNPTPGLPTAVIPILSNTTRFRRMASVRLTGYGTPLVPVTADDIVDNDGYARTNVYLIAGTNLNVKAYSGFPSVDITYYQDPDVDPNTGFNDWMCVDYPDLLIAGSAATVLAFDNEGEIYKAAKQEEAEQWSVLVENNLEPEAR